MYQSSTKSSSFNSYILFNINEQGKNIRETPTCLGFERILSAISPLLIQSTIYKPQPLHSGKVPKAKKERATHRYYIPFLQLILLFNITFFTSLTKIQKKLIPNFQTLPLLSPNQFPILFVFRPERLYSDQNTTLGMFKLLLRLLLGPVCVRSQDPVQEFLGDRLSSPLLR